MAAKTSGEQLGFFGERPPTEKERAKATRLARDAAKQGLSSEELQARRVVRAAVKEMYFAEFKRVRGVEIVLWDGADETALDRFLTKADWRQDEAMKVVTNAFAHPIMKGWVTIRDLARDPAKYQGVSRQAPGHLQRGNVAPSRNDRARKPEDY